VLQKLLLAFGEAFDRDAKLDELTQWLAPRHAEAFQTAAHTWWWERQVSRVAYHGATVTEVWERSVLEGSTGTATSYLAEAPTQELLLPYFMIAPRERTAEATTFGQYVFRERSPDPRHTVRHGFLTRLGEAAATELRSQGLSKVTGENNDRLRETIGRIGFDWQRSHYGEFTSFPLPDGVNPYLRDAVAEAGGILGFMRGMVERQRVGSIGWDDFQTIWRLGGPNVEWLKNQFRAIDPGMHEWIPTNLIQEVLAHAVAMASPDRNALADALDWITAFHELRSPTNHVLWQVDSIDAAVPEHRIAGHVGAFAERVGQELRPRATVGSEYFHDLLRDHFRANRSMRPRTFVESMRSLVEHIVWDGSLPPGAALDSPVRFLHRGEAGFEQVTLGELARRQRHNHRIILAMFTQVAGRLSR
jgi:hypothetical protein